MPELPEVETVRRDLEVLVGQTLKNLEIIAPKSASHPAAFFKAALLGRRVKEISRRGKLLAVSFVGGEQLLIHLKMTGQLIYEAPGQKIAGGHSERPGSYEEAVSGPLPNRHTRAILEFSRGRLFFNDLRRFGYLKLANKEELALIIAKNYGPEPLEKEFSVEYLSKSLKNRKKNIKAALLDQKIIAGLGNIYVDESLFAAGIRPSRLASSLKPREIGALHQAIRKIIKQAILFRGTTFSNYVDSRGQRGNFSRRLKVYGRSQEPCLVCGRPLVKVKLAGRGTHYCPNCQK
jgi:formamidopyrimidine-DNA glycosylase